MGARRDFYEAALDRTGLPYRLHPPPDGRSSVDCSILIQHALRDIGVSGFPRTAEDQRKACVRLPPGVGPSLGDLYFFRDTYDAQGVPGDDGYIASHVGIVTGPELLGMMLDAHERAGSAVGLTRITTNYWAPKMLGAYSIPGLAALENGSTPPMPDTMPLGIDVASYQGFPDWAQVAGSGVRFAITKATEGSNYINHTLEHNLAGTKANNIFRGTYHFARPDLNPDPAVEAGFYLSVIQSRGLEVGDLLALDLEDDPSGSLQKARRAGTNVAEWTLRWLSFVESRTGTKPLLYTARNVIDDFGLARYPALGDFGLWLASWNAAFPAAPAPWGVVAFWQKSASLRVEGISGDVDEDYFNGPAENIRKYGYKAGDLPVTDPAPVDPAPTPPPFGEIDRLQEEILVLKSTLGYLTHEVADAMQKEADALKAQVSSLEAAISTLRRHAP